MKEIETVCVNRWAKGKKKGMSASILSDRTMEALLSSAAFIADVRKIRDRFKIPDKGFLNRRRHKVTDKLTPAQEKSHADRTARIFALIFDQSFLKEKQIKMKSKKDELALAVKKLRLSEKLPITFQYALTHYVVYGGWPKVLEAGCVIRVYDDHGEKRIFLELLGYTTIEDMKRAWRHSSAKNLKNKHGLLGQQLADYVNYYRDKYNSDNALSDEKSIRANRFRKANKTYGYSK